MDEMTIALQATVLAILFAIPYGLLCAGNKAPGLIPQPVRRQMEWRRSINELSLLLCSSSQSAWACSWRVGCRGLGSSPSHFPTRWGRSTPTRYRAPGVPGHLSMALSRKCCRCCSVFALLFQNQRTAGQLCRCRRHRSGGVKNYSRPSIPADLHRDA